MYAGHVCGAWESQRLHEIINTWYHSNMPTWRSYRTHIPNLFVYFSFRNIIKLTFKSSNRNEYSAADRLVLLYTSSGVPRGAEGARRPRRHFRRGGTLKRTVKFT